MIKTSRNKNQRHNTRKHVYYRDAEKALKNLDAILGKSQSDARDSVLKLMQLLLNKGRRVVLYLGAGCSVAVDVKPPKNYGQFVGRSWVDLLRGLLDTMSRDKREEFLQSLGKRAQINSGSDEVLDINQILQYFDRLQVAWYLSSRFSPKVRDEELGKLVEPPAGSTATSPLHKQLLRLPFNDIVTTNYDSHIARFLREPDEERVKEISFTEITNSTDLISSKSERSHRLFYLHGKVGGQSPLVFDRFDYARLMAERDGILDYVTYLLMDSHVIYVGFGLDDPTFNLMETRLQNLHGVYRPQSFAFIPVATEIERTAWRKRNLDIIDYGNHQNLPAILQCVNTTLNFVTWAEPLRSRDVDVDLKADRTKGYMADALDNYVRGKYDESLLECRAALASTLFWERPPSPIARSPQILPFERATRLCEIRIRMALNHYKLHWAPDKKEEHLKALEENEDAARNILKEQNKHLSLDDKHVKTRTLRALSNSLDILKARVLYHDGQFVQAQERYERVIKSGSLKIPEKKSQKASLPNQVENTPAPISDKLLEERRSTVLWKLKFAEGYFYAKCQVSRIAYQIRRKASKGGLTSRDEQVQLLDDLVKEIQKTRKFIDESESECGTVPEWDYFLNSISILHRIAVWTAGRHAVGVCRDVIPMKDERCQEIYDRLSQGILRLENDPVPTDRIKWEMSQRWFALRYRYLCRAYALRWVVGQGLGGAAVLGDADLIDAYKAIQKALHVAAAVGLERERMVNLLEAARLNILAMFGERVGKNRSRISNVSPLSFAAGLHYLDAAFRQLDEMKKGPEVGWLQILGYRIASYFVIVSAERRDPEIERVRDNSPLFRFLNKDVAQGREMVAGAYKEFAKRLGNSKILDQRIEYYQKCSKAISEELATLRPSKRLKAAVARSSGSA